MSEPQSPQPRPRNSPRPRPMGGRGHPPGTGLPPPRYPDATTASPRPSAGLRLARPRRSQTRLGRRTACGSHDHADHRLASAVGRPAARTTTPITDSPRPSDGLRLARPRRSRGERPGGAPEPGGNPAAERDRELLRNRHRDALTEHTEPSRLDLVEQGEVDPPHDLGRHERARVGRGKALPCDPVELPRAYRLVGHQAHERLGVTSPLQIVDGDAERPEVFLRHIHAPGPGVGADVADDVRELECLAQLDRVLARAGVRVAEDLDAAEPDRRGDAVAVRVELLRRLVGDAVEVHLDAVDDRLERRARDRVGAYGGLEPERDRVVGDRARRVAARHLLAPAPELPALDRRGRAPPAPPGPAALPAPGEGADPAERPPTRARAPPWRGRRPRPPSRGSARAAAASP